MSSSRSTSATAPANCRDTVAQFGDLLDGDIDRAAHLAVGRHLERCAPCAAHLESLSGAEYLLRWAFDAGDRR